MTGEGQRLSLLFTARHKPGQLAVVLDQIGAAALIWSASKAAPCPMYLLSIIFMYSLSVPRRDAAACNSLLETLTGACSTLRLLGALYAGRHRPTII